MAVPLILAGLMLTYGAKKAYDGASKMKDANDKIKSAKDRHEANVDRYKRHERWATEAMDAVGKTELEILQSFERFSRIMEKIQNKPEFRAIDRNGVEISTYSPSELKDASVGAGILLGGLGGAAVGTAGGFAAAGATSAAVMALGTASTGTAIASLSGAAATNATLALLGGGTLAAGGGGVALGSAVLGAGTLGVGLLIGGLIMNAVGGSLSDKADEAWDQMLKAEDAINRGVVYLDDLKDTARSFSEVLNSLNALYQKHVSVLGHIVEYEGKTEWEDFTSKDRKITENTVLLVSLLYNLCKVKLVLQAETKDEVNQVNHKDIDEAMENTNRGLDGLDSSF